MSTFGSISFGTTDYGASPFNTRHGAGAPRSPAQSNSGRTIGVSNTGTDGPRSEGQTGRVDESPEAADLTAAKQRAHKQSAGQHTQNSPAPDVAPAHSGIPPQGVQQKNESAMTNDNVGDQTQTGGVAESWFSAVQGSFNAVAPLSQWMMQATYSGATNLAAYAAPVIGKGAKIASSAASEAASIVMKTVSAYQSKNLIDEPVRAIMYMREWKAAAEGFNGSLEEVKVFGASVESVRNVVDALTVLRCDSFRSESVREACGELKSLFTEKSKNAHGYISVDLQRLELFNGLMSQYVSFMGEEKEQWQGARAALIKAISEFPGKEGLFSVPDVPSEWKDVSCNPVRAINLYAGSSDIESVQTLDISGKGSPEYAELAGLMFWLELLKTELKLGSTVDVNVVRAFEAKAVFDPDQVD